jgi:hypothetical protein
MKIRKNTWRASALAILAIGPSIASPAWSAPAQSRSAGHALEIDFGKDAIQATAAQTAAIRRVAAADIKEFVHPEQGGYAVALADLDDDGRPDLLVQYDDIAFCGSTGCSGLIVMAAPEGYAATSISLPNFGTLAVLPSRHNGMHDLQFNGDSPIWRWNGRQYDIAKADMPGANAPAWQTRQAAGRTLAMVVPIESGIKTVSVFCDQGKPVLAMLAKAPQPRTPLTLAFGFRGWTVNVPMAQGNGDGTLWFADLSRSELPEWLAHRGDTATTRELAKLATESFLRINGTLQGQISLQDSTAATQAALAACYRY